MKATVTSLIFFVALLLCQLGCWGRLRPPTDGEIIGVYAARYATGEVETLELKKDGIAEQIVYPNKHEYMSEGKFIHKNSGKWLRKNKDQNFIELMPQLECYEIMRDGTVRLRTRPERIDEGLCLWIGDQEHSKTTNSKVCYDLDRGIMLDKVADRSVDIRLLGKNN